LLRDAPVVHAPAAVNAAAKPCGVEHSRLDHLEDLAFEHMRRDLGIAAAFKLRPVVQVIDDWTMNRKLALGQATGTGTILDDDSATPVAS